MANHPGNFFEKGIDKAKRACYNNGVKLGVDIDIYRSYEKGEIDFSFSFSDAALSSL